MTDYEDHECPECSEPCECSLPDGECQHGCEEWDDEDYQ